ncbi:MAG: choice-of-anchor D domain-containing protein [Verrucomicrobia bacterium]|nr:choice-of-anchor D domain-containing protein [Verrucomicrobiota bacterium]
MATSRQEALVAKRKRKRVLFLVKIVVFLLIIGNLGLLGWYVLRDKSGIRLGEHGPELRAEPEAIEFGESAAGTVLTRDVTIRNRTARDLEVAQVTFTSDVFGLREPFGGCRLPPRGQTTLTVVYAPRGGGDDDCEMRVQLAGASKPCLRVPVHGRTLRPQLGVSANSLNFGDVATTGGARLTLKISNKGNAPLRIAGVTVQGEGFGLVTPFAAQTLGSKQVITLEVAFVPARMGACQGSLVIASSDPDQAKKTIPLSASYRRAESSGREIAQAQDVLRKAKEDLTTAYALLTFESTNKSLMATNRRMGREKLEQAWPNYEQANRILSSIDPRLVDTEFYVDKDDILHKRSAE